MSRRAVERSAPMTSSTSRRLPQKTSGLFDTGFAGGAPDATSLDLNAQAVLPSDQDPFAAALGDLFEADAFTESASFSFVDSALGLKEAAQIKPVLEVTQPEPVTPLLGEWDALAGLGTNQLAEDSLDAFINLDDFLSGDNFLYDDNKVDDNKTINTMHLEADVAELNPEFLNLNFLELQPVPVVDSPQKTEENATVSSTTAACTAKTKRALKRKANNSSGPVKTSMFEIDAAPSTKAPTSVQPLDHDYTAKRKKVQKTSVSSSNEKTGRSAAAETPSSSNVWATDLLLSNTDSGITSSTAVDKQTVRRMKNNVASKRSREQRKQKFAEMDLEAEQLIEANAKLKVKIVELEKLAKEMKSVLVAKMAGAK